MVLPQRPGLTRRQWLLLCRSGAAVVPVALFAPKLLAAAEPGREATLLQHTARPGNLETPLEFLNTQLLPVEKFYVRSHFEVPIMRADFYQLRVDIGGDKVLKLSLKQLQDEFKPVTITAVLQCAGNGRALHRPRVGGVQWRKGACGNAEWTGVRLGDVLARAGVKKGTLGHLEMAGADTPASPQTPQFVRSLPLAKALHEDTLLAYAMNGAPLTKSHGFPLRVVVPGWVGDDWLKWVTDLRVRDSPSEGFYMQKGYRMPDPKAPEGSRPMTEMNVKSILSAPQDGARLPPVDQEIIGVAFSGEAHITKVEVSTDDGETWHKAKLSGNKRPYSWRVFRLAWKPTPGPYTILSRATDSKGAVQPVATPWNPGGYLYNAVDRIEVSVAGY